MENVFGLDTDGQLNKEILLEYLERRGKEESELVQVVTQESDDGVTIINDSIISRVITQKLIDEFIEGDRSYRHLLPQIGGAAVAKPSRPSSSRASLKQR